MRRSTIILIARCKCQGFIAREFRFGIVRGMNSRSIIVIIGTCFALVSTAAG
ncbi:MAG: hypothetical protein ACI91J_003073 [Yoonia sp.]|jgi:hypothetical protein